MLDKKESDDDEDFETETEEEASSEETEVSARNIGAIGVIRLILGISISY